MADIPSSLTKINDLEVSDNAPISEAVLYKVGGGINSVVDFLSAGVQSQVFTVSGNWVAPAGVRRVTVSGIGGGGGGSHGDVSDARLGGGGGGAGFRDTVQLTVVPGQTYAVVIGQGGTAAIPAANGTATSFGSLLTLAGGLGGALIYGGRGGSNGLNGATTAALTFGGNGGSGFGFGGLGGQGPANGGGVDPNSGAGGGGGGGVASGGNRALGAAGGTGILRVTWIG